MAKVFGEVGLFVFLFFKAVADVSDQRVVVRIKARVVFGLYVTYAVFPAYRGKEVVQLGVLGRIVECVGACGSDCPIGYKFSLRFLEAGVLDI